MLNRMKIGRAVLSVSLAMAGFSCTENNPAPAKSDLDLKAVLPTGIQQAQAGDTSVMISSGNVTLTPGDTAASPFAPQSIQSQPRGNPAALNGALAPATVAQRPAIPKEEIVVPPKDAKWTIFCTVVSGPDHTTRATALKRALAEKNGTKWYVIHDDEKSSIYYGFYRTIERGTREGDAAQADKQILANQKDSAGNAPFQLCSFLQIDKAAPDAPVEWDLGAIGRNPQRYWSLQVCAYTADASDGEGHDRKWAAVETVKEFRSRGVPAYYYHGDAISSVCIGAWPENSVKQQNGGGKGNAEAQNPNQSIFVSALPLPAGLTPKDPNGGQLRALAPRTEIIDPVLYQTIKAYPNHYLNNEEKQITRTSPVTGKPEKVSEPSFLVIIPEAKATAVQSIPGRQIATDPNQLPLLPPELLGADQPHRPAQSGVGRLRSVGE